jgi:hypothetical protein
VKPNAPLQMLVTNIDYDEHKGRIAIGRVTGGTIKKAQQVGFVCACICIWGWGGGQCWDLGGVLATVVSVAAIHIHWAPPSRGRSSGDTLPLGA